MKTVDELNTDEPFVEICGTHYLGAIIPASRVARVITEARWLPHVFIYFSESFWTPDESDIRQLETGLLHALEEQKRDRFICENLSNYRRQYIGCVNKGKRCILVSSFYDPGGGKEYWLNNLVRVFDGGCHYWRILFEPATGQYLFFHQNGYA